MKTAYAQWIGYYATLPKVHRHTLGQRVDDLFVESMEHASAAGFTSGTEKIPDIRMAVRKLDTMKLLLLLLWETKSLDTKKYAALSLLLEEIGSNLGGWHGSLLKKNSPFTGDGEK